MAFSAARWSWTAMALRTVIESAQAASAETRRLSLLYLAGAESPPDWLSRALSAEPDGNDFHITEVMSLAAMLEQLRDAPYDVCLVDEDASDRAASELIGAIRSGANQHQAVIVLSDRDTRQHAAKYLAAGAAAYLSIPRTTSAELICHLRRAEATASTALERDRLQGWWAQRGRQDQQSIQNLLHDEQTLVKTWQERWQAPPPRTLAEVDDAITQQLRPACRDLLEAYLLLGREDLADDVRSFAILLRDTELPLACLLEDYLFALSSLATDRGVRSARHVVDRGHLLLLEILLSWTGKADA